ncbi:hypothetical protein WJX72_006360 [[Myrmecia] bisecta]|uniref:Uncharacterized protein n=1 Tax=[Myrmecia] bisecta TaxID=41462 RepID=A0AAW1PHB3_9CHLO
MAEPETASPAAADDGQTAPSDAEGHAGVEPAPAERTAKPVEAAADEDEEEEDEDEEEEEEEEEEAPQAGVEPASSSAPADPPLEGEPAKETAEPEAATSPVEPEAATAASKALEDEALSKAADSKASASFDLIGSKGAEDHHTPVRQYLDSTIVPVLREGLRLLVKERPADPFEFLGDYIKSQGSIKAHIPK